MNHEGKLATIASLAFAILVISGLVLAKGPGGGGNSCSDSDGGMFPNVFGTVSGVFKGKAYSSSDVCANDATVQEYYCSSDRQQSTLSTCGTDFYGGNYCVENMVYRDFTDFFCSSGACGSVTNSQLVQDCGDDSMGSTFCLNDDIYRNITDRFCNGGQCGSNVQLQFVEDCGTDYTTQNYCLNGHVYRNFVDNYCSNGGCGTSTSAALVQNCSNGCTDGVCNPLPPPPPPSSCFDSDGGWNPWSNGTVTLSVNGSTSYYTDFCLGNFTVREHYCLGNSAYGWENVACNSTTNVCIGGACR